MAKTPQWVIDTLAVLGGNRGLYMLGAKNIAYDDKKKNVTMKLPRNASGANYLIIHYDRGLDLYDLELQSIRKVKGTYKQTLKSELKGAYADLVGPWIERETGMYLSLGTMGGKMKNPSSKWRNWFYQFPRKRAVGPMQFGQPVSAKQVKEVVKDLEGSFPRGVRIWPVAGTNPDLWSQEATESRKYHTPKGLFTRSPKAIASVLLEGAHGDPGLAMRRITFYMNRAGSNLSPQEKTKLNEAKKILRKNPSNGSRTSYGVDPHAKTRKMKPYKPTKKATKTRLMPAVKNPKHRRGSLTWARSIVKDKIKEGARAEFIIGHYTTGGMPKYEVKIGARWKKVFATPSGVNFWYPEEIWRGDPKKRGKGLKAVMVASQIKKPFGR